MTFFLGWIYFFFYPWLLGSRIGQFLGGGSQFGIFSGRIPGFLALDLRIPGPGPPDSRFLDPQTPEKSGKVGVVEKRCFRAVFGVLNPSRNLKPVREAHPFLFGCPIQRLFAPINPRTFWRVLRGQIENDPPGQKGTNPMGVA